MVEFYDPKLATLSPALRERIWRSRTQPLPPGVGSSVVTKIVAGDVLKDLLRAIGLDARKTLFLTTFGPVATSYQEASQSASRSKVWSIPVKDIAQLQALFSAPEEGVPPELCNLHLDVGALISGNWSQNIWAGVAWAASSSPFTGEKATNLEWHASDPLFQPVRLTWLAARRDHQTAAPPTLKWESGTLPVGLSVVRGTTAERALAGVYLTGKGAVWTVYDFPDQPAPVDPDLPLPDPNPGILRLQGAYAYLLQFGEPWGEWRRLILVDRQGRVTAAPVRAGRDCGTGE